MRTQAWRRMARELSALGGLAAYAFLTAIACVMGAWRIGLALALALVLCAAIAIPLRLLLPAARPSPRPAQGFIGRIDAASFPSMHAARMGILASVGALAHGWVLGIALTVVLVLVSASRVWLKEHRLRDVVAGAALGALCGLGMAWL